MKYYKKVKEVLTLVYSGDDRMDQDTLFDLQEKLTQMALDIAKDEDQIVDLLGSFPFLFKCVPSRKDEKQ